MSADFFFFKQKTAYEMRISDWSSDVCSSDLLRLWRVVEVVEAVEDYFKQVDLAAGQKLQKDAKLGDFIVDPLPAVDLGRIDAQSAKQVIFQKVREADRERQFEEYKEDRKSTRLNSSH